MSECSVTTTPPDAETGRRFCDCSSVEMGEANGVRRGVGKWSVSIELIEQAKAGDGTAFAALTEPYRHQLQVHCYRMLGSFADAEDALQDTLLAAWQGLGGFEGRSSFRTWLYQVATNRCLNILRAARRRPAMDWSNPDVEPPEPTGVGEVPWLEPYPDALFEGSVPASEPESRYEASEAISLAFVTALQLLPARQRAVLILRDVLGFRAAEVVDMLETSLESVTSALKRARASIGRRLENEEGRAPAPQRGSTAERELAERLTRAYEIGDLEGLVALLTEDVRLAMPPVQLEYQGRGSVARFTAAVSFRHGRTYRLMPTRANGQLAFGAYLRDPTGGPSHAMGLLVFTLGGERVRAITRFDNSVLMRFGLPRTLPAE